VSSEACTLFHTEKKFEAFAAAGNHTYTDRARGETVMPAAPLATVLRQLRQMATSRLADEEADRELLRRFTATQDRQAFEALVRRHGPLVLGVCRHVLRQEQDAEDAFQATFLVLARRAASVRDAGAVASWLYGVAQRTALEAKRAARRRRVYETRARSISPLDPCLEAARREEQTVLADEIRCLPDPLRDPLVLCHVDGHSRAAAADRLGLTEGTVWSRLARARQLLSSRLARRGVTLAAVPAALVASTARAAEAAARGNVPDVSERVLALADGGRALSLARLKLGLMLALTLGLLAAGVVVLAHSGLPADPAAELEKAAARPASDRYGDPLPPGALARLGTVRLRHKEAGRCVTFSRDGRQLVTAADDDSVRIWDLADAREHLVLHTEGGVSALALSPDGKVLATASGKTVRLWDAKTGHKLRQMSGSGGLQYPGPVAFSHDGATLAVGAHDGSIRLFLAKTGEEFRTLSARSEKARCFAFSADDQTLFSIGGEATAAPLCVWNVALGRLTREVPIKSPGDIRIRPLALASDGKTLAVECVTQEKVKNAGGWSAFCQYRLCLWDVADGRERLRTEGERDVLWSAAFSADGKSVATAGMGGHVRVWDATTGKLRVALANVPGGSRADASETVAFSPDGKRVAAVGDGAAARVWDVSTGGELPGLPAGHQAAVREVAYSPDGRTAASAGDDHTIRLWDAATGQPQRVLKGHPGAVVTLAYAPDGRTLASADHEDALRLWDPVGGKELLAIQAVPRTAGVYFGICPLAFTPDGKELVSWGGDRYFRFWDRSTGKERRSRPLVLSGVPAEPEGRPQKYPAQEVKVNAVRFSPDGRTCAAAVGSDLFLLDASTGQELFKVPGGQPPVVSLAFSPDGRTLVSGGWDKVIHLWDVASGRELLRVDAGGFVNAVALAPDGRTFAAATGWVKDGEIRLLDGRTGQMLLRLRGHESYTGALAFAPDGKTLASGHRDTTALVWDLTPGLKRLTEPKRELSPEELQTLWTQLAGADAKKARQAVEALAAAPASALPFLKDRLHAAERVKPGRVRQLIADLDSAEFTTREAATKELANRGAEAESALRSALNGDLSAEARRRVTALLDGPAPRDVPSGELLRRLRANHVLEQVGSPEALAILREMAAGAPSARETLDAKAACDRLAGRVAGK
jgi:RNA polymerase sigma factor (sigma-70 family)